VERQIVHVVKLTRGSTRRARADLCMPT